METCRFLVNGAPFWGHWGTGPFDPTRRNGLGNSIVAMLIFGVCTLVHPLYESCGTYGRSLRTKRSRRNPSRGAPSHP
eukprot:scaffold363_cov331-Pavlova_lutheri.AAC.31